MHPNRTLQDDAVGVLLAGGTRPVVAAVDVASHDGGRLEARVVRVAATLAAAAGARLHLVHAWSLLGESVLSCPVRGIGRERLAALRGRTRRERGERLRALARTETGGREVEIWVAHGRPGQVVRRIAERVDAQLVVMGSMSPPALPGLVVGGMAEALAGSWRYSVVLVPAGGMRPPGGREEGEAA